MAAKPQNGSAIRPFPTKAVLQPEIKRQPDRQIAASTELLKVALTAATAAGDVVLARQHEAADSACTKSGPFDLVTVADLAAEDMIRRQIIHQRPNDTVLGEERGSHGSGLVRWLVDPLDGTTNYIVGLSAWAVSIAAEINGEVVAGVVHAPAMGRTYTAKRGEGAWCNGNRLSGPRARHLRDAVVATGFSADAAKRPRQLQLVASWLPYVRDIRCHGAASLELCFVAAGDLDAYIESGLRTWDIAAGALIAQEAGSAVIGGPGTTESLIVAAPVLAGPLARMVAGDSNRVGGGIQSG